MKTSSFSHSVTGLALCLAPVAAAVAQVAAAEAPLAQPAAQGRDLPAVVVTAARVQQPLTDVLADVTLIDAEHIRNSGAVNVGDLLARQPGFEMGRNGGPGTTTSLFLRGAEARHLAVLVDGVRIDTQNGSGGAPLEALSLGQIDRIEIVRGAAAAVYGTDAVAGVVQIFTRKGEDGVRPMLGVSVGSKRTGKVEAGLSGKSGAVDYAVSAERATSRGFDATSTKGSNPDRDGYRQTAASARVGVQVNPAHRVEFSTLYGHMNVGYDAYQSDKDDRSINRISTVGLSWSAQWTAHWHSQLQIGESHQRYATRPSHYLTKTATRTYTWLNSWRSGAHHLTATLERKEDRLANSSVSKGGGDKRHQNALALGYGYHAGAHALQLGVRHDHHNEFGGKTTGNIAYGYSFAPGWRISAAAGTAFKIPTLYQRFSSYGTPAIKPETSRNAELALRWKHGGSSAGVTLWRNRITNLVEWDSHSTLCASAQGSTGYPGCYGNVERVRLQGVTLAGEHRWDSHGVGASLEVRSLRNLDNGKERGRRAPRVFSAWADTRIMAGAHPVTLGVEVQAQSQRYDNNRNSKTLPGYGIVNLYANASLGRDWSLLARLDNVGNKRYQTALGYNTAGRMATLTLRYQPR